MKFFLIMSSVFLWIATSCINDDKETVSKDQKLPINNTNIAGKWYMKGGTINGAVFQDYHHKCSTKKDYEDFLTNGNLNNVEFQSDCNNTAVESSNWSLSGTTLSVISLPGAQIQYSYVYNVEHITTSELVLKYTHIDNGIQTVEVSTYTRN